MLHGVNDFGPISSWLNSHGCTFLAKPGKLSMYVYLFHVQVILLCKHVIIPEHSLTASLFYLALVLSFSALVMATMKRMRRHSTH